MNLYTLSFAQEKLFLTIFLPIWSKFWKFRAVANGNGVFVPAIL